MIFAPSAKPLVAALAQAHNRQLLKFEAENYFMRQQVTKQETQLRGAAFSFKLIEDNNKLCKLYTGLSTTAIFLRCMVY